MFLIGIIKTLVIGILDAFYMAFIKNDINNIPFEETNAKMATIYRSIITIIILCVVTLLVSVIMGFAEKAKKQSEIIEKQVAIIRECREGYSEKNNPIYK